MIETKLYKISDIKPNPNNPRIIKDDKFLKLVNSIKEFPEMLKIRPIVINEDNIVLGGNMRLKACKEAKLKEIPVIMASELTEAQQREFIIKDNIGFGEWDFQDLAQNWNAEELETWGLDLPELEINNLEAVEDDFEVPENGIETDIVLGDLFEIGEHRLMCGDSTDSDSVAKLMNGNKADIMLIDPPYNINFKAQRSGKGYETHNDNLDNKDYLNLVTEIYNNAFLFTDKAIITCGKQNLKMWIENFDVTDIGIWIAKNKMSGGKISNLSLWEPILFIGKFDRNSRSNDLFEFNNKFQKEANGHPCPKVIDFFIELIKCYTKNSVLDFFMGSGTTMIAAHQLKRKCFGMELDPKYCEVIIQRMKKLEPEIVIKRNGIVI
jgi:16S rRNA G966 N2-methylase RsmD